MKELENIRIVRCDESEAEACLKIRDDIFAELKERGESHLYLADETDEQFKAFFKDDDSIIIGAYRNGKLVGCEIASYRPEMLERFRPLVDRGLIDAREFDAPNVVAYFELAQVEASARGFGLQRTMYKSLEKFVKERGARYCCAIVSPENKHSLGNLRSSGFEIVEKFVHQETGFVRYKVLKRLS